MSERDIIPPEIPPRQQRAGCLAALGVLGGLILVFPFACVLIVFPNQITRSDLVDPIGLLFIGAAIAGLALIARAILRWRAARNRT